MSWPEVELISEGHGSIFYRAIYAIMGRAQTTINSLLPDPQAGLLSGILLGNDKGIPPDLAEEFRTTGLTHIISISGLRTIILKVRSVSSE
jgi:competence protein ComEC